MTLLYLSLAYMFGICLGWLLWDTEWIGCGFPSWLWLLPLVLMPATPLLNGFSAWNSPQHIRIRWPISAGFEVPTTGSSLGTWAALILCLLMGTFRYASQPFVPCWASTDLAYYNLPADRAYDRDAPNVTITGYISSYPLVSDVRQRLHIVAETVQTEDGTHNVQGELRLNTGIRQRYRYGQPIRLYGRLVTPPDFEDFSYREYLSRKGIYSLFYSQYIELLPGKDRGNPLQRSLYSLRARGEMLLNRLLPEPYAALANGMLLGIEAGIPDDLYEQFNLTGTSHVIVISGSNVSLIAGVLMALSKRILGRRRYLWPTLIGIGCYALLVGGDAAVLRAAFMGALYVMATAWGRRNTALVSLAVACWVMTILNPLTLWDVGFQLSSAATAGLIVFTPGVTTLFSKVWPGFSGGFLTASAGVAEQTKGLLKGLIQDGLLVTIAANITTMPLVVYYFGRLSIISFMTNLIIAPAQPFIMLWGSTGILVGVAGLVGWAWLTWLTWVAWLILLVPWFCLVWTVAMVQWTAELPWASLEIAEYSFGGLLMTYLIIFGFHWRTQIRHGFQQWLSWLGTHWQTYVLGPSAAGLLGVCCILVWAGALSQPDGRLHIHFLDIGQGDGILIETPSGRQVLIDGGVSPEALFSELGAVMPFWDRSIDLLILSHPDADHMDAQIEVPKRFDGTMALDTSVSQANQDAEPWRMAMASAGIDVYIQQTGGWVDLGDGVALWVLWPPPGGYRGENVDNENSIVLKLVYGDFSLLLTGDAGRPSEVSWLDSGIPLASTVLKVGHHGSTSATSDTFLQAVNPSVAVIQSGAENRYGHPHPEVLDTLEGRVILRNDLHGRVHIWSDGHQMWIETERSQFEPYEKVQS